MAETSIDSQLEGLFTRLDLQLKNSQFKKALKLVDESEPKCPYISQDSQWERVLSTYGRMVIVCVCACAVLKLSPGDKDAVRSKVVALIELSRFDKAVEVINSSILANDLAFEKVSLPYASTGFIVLSCIFSHFLISFLSYFLQAYSLFRLGNFTDALTALQAGSTEQIVAKLQLDAQLYYRMGRNGDAIRIYHQLFKDHKVGACHSADSWNYKSCVRLSSV